MQRLHHRDSIPEALRGAIIALGNFDGFHLGHQRVAEEAIEWARAQGRPAIVATFDPHPVRHFRPDAPPFRLTTLDQRQELFGEAGAAAMLVFDFGDELASTSAEGFVDLLAGHLGAAGVVTGEDFSFGKGRSGNVEVLRDLGRARRMETRRVGPVSDAEEVVSSSRIRDATPLRLVDIDLSEFPGKFDSTVRYHCFITRNVHAFHGYWSGHDGHAMEHGLVHLALDAGAVPQRSQCYPTRSI